MSISTLIWILLGLSSLAYYLGLKRALAISGGQVRHLHSLPSYYGYYTALWCGLPALAFLILWTLLEERIIILAVGASLPEELQNLPSERLELVFNQVRTALSSANASEDPVICAAADRYRALQAISNRCLAVVALMAAGLGAMWARRRIRPDLPARNLVEKTLETLLAASSALAILTTVGILLSVLFESIRFFELVPATEFLFGLNWSPQLAIRPDQVGASGAFGFIPLLVGTLLTSAVAMAVAAPIGLLSAIYLAEFAHPQVRAVAKPLLEILAGVPTVVYGFFAALVVAPFLRQAGEVLGLTIASESALGAGLVMGIMIVPFVSSISEDVIHAVPQSLRDGAYALGATRAEAITQVVIPAALPGIVGGMLLAISRAIGETMIVVMAAGLTAKLTINPLDSVTTITVQIVTLLIGDQEFDSPKTLAAFALGLVLFVLTLGLNVIALYVVRKYRESYE
ncbi:MAG: phosphate ABC transporter permease subunit PstC [Methylohalobius sp.]|nr:phosphate ABC transporter permease subunit PstC [Methylohalobius sp.]